MKKEKIIRNKRIMVWVSDDEKNLLETKSKYYGYKTFAAYIRDAAIFEKITHVDIEGKQELYDIYSKNLKELKKIIKELKKLIQYATELKNSDVRLIKNSIFNIINNQKEITKLLEDKLNYESWQEINRNKEMEE